MGNWYTYRRWVGRQIGRNAVSGYPHEDLPSTCVYSSRRRVSQRAYPASSAKLAYVPGGSLSPCVGVECADENSNLAARRATGHREPDAVFAEELGRRDYSAHCWRILQRCCAAPVDTP